MAPAAPASTTAPVDRIDRLRARLPAGVNHLVASWTVVVAGPRAGYLALTEPGPRTITLYVRSGQGDGELAAILAHEYGHALDVDRLSDMARTEWMARRGFPGLVWYGCANCTDYATPAGDWAEAVASCLTGGTAPFRSRLAGRPSAADCAWVSAAVGGW